MPKIFQLVVQQPTVIIKSSGGIGGNVGPISQIFSGLFVFEAVIDPEDFIDI